MVSRFGYLRLFHWCGSITSTWRVSCLEPLPGRGRPGLLGKKVCYLSAREWFGQGWWRHLRSRLLSGGLIAFDIFRYPTTSSALRHHRRHDISIHLISHRVFSQIHHPHNLHVTTFHADTTGADTTFHAFTTTFHAGSTGATIIFSMTFHADNKFGVDTFYKDRASFMCFRGWSDGVTA